MTLKRGAGRTHEHSLDDVEEGLKQGHADVIRVDLEVEQHGEAVRLRRSVFDLSTPALMALLVQGVGYYFSAIPLQQRLGAGAEVDSDHAAGQAARLAEFVLAALLSEP